MTGYLVATFTNFRTSDFLQSFEDHDNKRLCKTFSQDSGEEISDLLRAGSTDFAGLRKSGTANFSLLLNKSFSQELPIAAFNEPAIETSEVLGKRKQMETATPPKSAKKSKGKSRGNSAKSSKVKGKGNSKSPLKDQTGYGSGNEQMNREIKKQFSFGDLSLAFNSAAEKGFSRAPSLADLGIAVKLEGNQDYEPKSQEKMNLRSQSSPKPGKYTIIIKAKLQLKKLQRPKK